MKMKLMNQDEVIFRKLLLSPDLRSEAGKKLPFSERSIAEHFSVSRGTVRQALARLSAAGCLSSRERSGLYASGPRLTLLLGPEGWIFEPVSAAALSWHALDDQNARDGQGRSRVGTLEGKAIALERLASIEAAGKDGGVAPCAMGVGVTYRSLPLDGPPGSGEKPFLHLTCLPTAEKDGEICRELYVLAEAVDLKMRW